MNENILDYFGKILISEVRDETIINWDMMLNGKMKGITAQEFKNKLKIFNNEQLSVLNWIIPKITDTCVHNFLNMIEQNDEIKMKVYDGESDKDIEDISDGLAGELYTEDGWISKYSKQRYDEI